MGSGLGEGKRRTHVDKVLVVADEEISQDAGLVQVAQRDHVLDAVDGRRVHGFDAPLRCQPLFLSVRGEKNVAFISLIRPNT